jgi:hypothetical protein
MLAFMGQRFVPYSGYRQRQAKLFNYVKTQGKIQFNNSLVGYAVDIKGMDITLRRF